MSSTLKLLSKINRRTKDIVIGWIRELEKCNRMDDIPSLINALCILYYREDEIFETVGSKLSVSGNRKTVMLKRKNNIKGHIFEFSAYGSYQIPYSNTLKHQWDIYVDKEHGAVEIGVADENKLNYTYSCDGSLLDADFAFKQVEPYTTHDIISVVLDMEHGKLSWLKNYIEQSAVIDLIYHKYRLLISIGKPGAVTILDYSINGYYYNCFGHFFGNKSE